ECQTDIQSGTVRRFRDLAPGRAGILSHVHFPKQAERDNAVGLAGCVARPHTVELGWVGSGRISQVGPKSVVRSTCPFLVRAGTFTHQSVSWATIETPFGASAPIREGGRGSRLRQYRILRDSGLTIGLRRPCSQFPRRRPRKTARR